MASVSSARDADMKETKLVQSRAPSFCPTGFGPKFFFQSYYVKFGRNGLDGNRLDQNELDEK